MGESDQPPLSSTPPGDAPVPAAAAEVVQLLPARRFSRFATFVYFLFAAAGLLYLAEPYLSQERVELLSEPFKCARITAERGLDFYEASRADGRLLRWIYWFGGYSPGQAVPDALSMYQEVLSHNRPMQARRSEAAKLRAHLAVLLAETGQTNALVAELNQLKDSEDFTLYATMMRRAYLDLRRRVLPTDGRLALKLEPGWAQDRLRARLAFLAGDGAEVRRSAEAIQARGKVWRTRILEINLFYLSVIIGGGVLLLWLLRRPRSVFPTPETAELAPWPVADGYGVILRAAVWGLMLFLGAAVLGNWPMAVLAEYQSELVAGLPMLWLLHRHLLRPCELKFAEHFGFSLDRLQVGQLLAWVLALNAVNWAGGFLVGSGSQWLGLEPHWTDGLDEDLMYGTLLAKLGTLVNGVVFAPFFEEVFFRGLLFATMRRHLSLLRAALLSGVIFGTIHFYSWPGFLDVTWFGFLYALIYARTRSLTVCVLAHALNNLASMLSTVLLLG